MEGWALLYQLRHQLSEKAFGTACAALSPWMSLLPMLENFSAHPGERGEDLHHDFTGLLSRCMG